MKRAPYSRCDTDLLNPKAQKMPWVQPSAMVQPPDIKGCGGRTESVEAARGRQY
jgi:hypothetical protein